MKTDSKYTNEIIPADAAPTGWREIEGGKEGDLPGIIEVRFKLPFDCYVNEDMSSNTPGSSKIYRDAEIVFHIPVGKFAIFTEQCTKTTIEAIGKKSAKGLFDDLATQYYGKMILEQMLQTTTKSV